uniref:RING-type domain-containing protein n=1 Tax=Sinocyclocheilus anshuiensis TaxID=1608454 RepID=A0A671RR85_9TELE
MDSLSVEELSCLVCCEIFKAPVLLSCSHSVCKECLQQFWRTIKTQECPVCRRRSSRDDPPCNLVLEDKQPVCLVCRDSQKHINHTFRPIRFCHKDIHFPLKFQENLSTALKSLQGKVKDKTNIIREFEKTVKHIKSQADHTERQIKQQFEKLHQFLRDEEETTITALREEEDQKKQMMEKKLEEINRHISALSQSIKDTEEMMKASDVCFLKISSQPDPQTPSGALIHVPHYLGNLPFRVWKKMQDIIQNKILQFTDISFNPKSLHNAMRNSKYGLNSCKKSMWKIPFY